LEHTNIIVAGIKSKVSSYNNLHGYIDVVKHNLFIFLFVELLFQSQSCQFQYQVYRNGNPYGIAEGIVFSMPCRSKVSLFTVSSFFLISKIAFIPPVMKVFIQLGDGDYELVKDAGSE